MKSTTGTYFQALDHVRALAIFLVFIWHFYSFDRGALAPPISPVLSVLTEGHTGVSIFMTLSGYLFAKLIGDHRIDYRAFLANRFVRLAPLLLVAFFLSGIETVLLGGQLSAYLSQLAYGLVLPTWPNGAWSIAAEIYFYLILPLLLVLARWRSWAILLVVALALGARAFIWHYTGSVSELAYYTIVGRIDQFVMGIFAWRIMRGWTVPWPLALTAVPALLAFLYVLDLQGGLFGTNGNFDYSRAKIWIIVPTVEAMAYALLIRWYDGFWKGSDHLLARAIARVGAYSYSIYLLHFFIVFRMPYWLDRFLPMQNDYLLLALAPVGFMVMIPIGWLSFRFIESPFFKLRRPYIQPAA